MHVISLTKLKRAKHWLCQSSPDDDLRVRTAWHIHPAAERNLQTWYKLTSVHQWQSFNDVRLVFPSADKVKNFIVFDIGGNKFRLITYVDFKHQKVFIRSVWTHAEYDKQRWKQDDWYQ